MAVPYDLPVVGYGNHIVNTLRIWDAEAIDTFNLDSFDKGDYQKAVEQQNLARTICEVLYPNGRKRTSLETAVFLCIGKRAACDYEVYGKPQ